MRDGGRSGRRKNCAETNGHNFFFSVFEESVTHKLWQTLINKKNQAKKSKGKQREERCQKSDPGYDTWITLQENRILMLYFG